MEGNHRLFFRKEHRTSFPGFFGSGQKFHKPLYAHTVLFQIREHGGKAGHRLGKKPKKHQKGDQLLYLNIAEKGKKRREQAAGQGGKGLRDEGKRRQKGFFFLLS